MAKLSNGYTGNWSRNSDEAIQEIESRMSDPKTFLPNDGELGPGQNPNKLGVDLKPHDDLATIGLPSAYNKKVQKSFSPDLNQAELDAIDFEENKLRVNLPKLKPIVDDPLRLNEHKLSLNDRVEHRLKKLKGVK